MSVDEIQADSLNGRLYAAVVHGRVDELRALVELGADFDVKAANGHTPMHAVAGQVRNGHVDAVRALVELGADCNVKSADKCTPLHFAAGNGEFEVYSVRKEGRRQCGRWSSSGPTAMRRVRMDALRCI